MSNDEIAALYPPPPPYYEFFTRKNIKKVNEWINSGKSEELSDELKFLLPPERPEGPRYRMFGDLWLFEDKMPSLKEMGIEQLYDRGEEEEADEEKKEVKEEAEEVKEEEVKEEEEEEKEEEKKEEEQEEKDKVTLTSQDKDDTNTASVKRIEELKKLFKSLLLNFLELIGIISKNAMLKPEKLQEIRIILTNIHHLLNEYRPHQARESLILMLQNQVNSTKQEIAKIRKGCAEVRTILPTLAKEIEVIEEKEEVEEEEDEMDVVKRAVLEEVEAEFGS